MTRRWSYLLAIGFCAVAVSFTPARPTAAQVNIFTKPAWEKDVRRVMWRHRNCVKFDSFIWEVGDTEKVITRDFSLKGAPPSEKALVPLHEVSAFIFATYAAQMTQGNFTPAQINDLTMRSGYTAPMSQNCRAATSFGSCFRNMSETRGAEGTFFYGPAPLKKMAVDMGLGTFRDGDLRDEYSSALGAPATHFQFETTRILDGLRMSPNNLSRFIRHLLSGNLKMNDMLGQHAVCLDPSQCQAPVTYAPAPRNRDYSLGHWVEKNPATGETEAFSMAGKSGIYVWISGDRKYYGYMIPRDDGINRSMDGIACGRAMMRTVMRATQTSAP